MDGVFADSTEPWTPLFPEGERGKQKHHRREIKDDWLNQKAEVPHGRRALAPLQSHREIQPNSSVTPWSRRGKSHDQVYLSPQVWQGRSHHMEKNTPSH